MPFGATANPTTVAIPNPGDTQDVVFTFTDVPTDASGTETFMVPGQPQVEVTLTFPGADPQSVGFTVPAGVSRQLVSIDDATAVVRYTRT